MQGILFTEAMFNAIVEGRKTQTRRIIKPQPSPESMKVGMVMKNPNPKVKPGDLHMIHPGTKESCFARPRYRAGETIYLKEPYIDDLSMDTIFYKFNPEDRAEIEKYHPVGNPWKNKLFMPAEAARNFISITDVRAERVADISEEDAIAEGLMSLSKDGGRTYKYGIPDRDGYPGTCDIGMAWHDWNVSPCETFKLLWNSINNKWKKEKDGVKRRYPFDEINMKGEKLSGALVAETIPNPWVWVYEFKFFSHNPLSPF